MAISPSIFVTILKSEKMFCGSLKTWIRKCARCQFSTTAIRMSCSSNSMEKCNNSIHTHYSSLQEALLSESLIVVDRDDNNIGQRTKRDCHLVANISSGLLHRAFSVLLFNKEGNFLITQRAKTKITFPGYYTNSCCSHPLSTPMESEEKNALGVRRAAQRRMYLELGIDPLANPIEDIHYMTRILYKYAPKAEMWGEHELDYLLVVRKDFDIAPDPDELEKYEYVSKDRLPSFLKEIETSGGVVSPWFKLIHDNFLYKYWDNLDNLDEVADHKTIHNFIA